MDTYADWLRARDDDELRALFASRPELIIPVPADLTALAARASSASAVSRALNRLDRLALDVFEALLVLPSPTAYADLAAAAGTDVRGALDRLRALALVWGHDDALRTAPGARQVVPHPTGLGPPIREAFASYPADRLSALLGELGLDSLDALPGRVPALVDDAGPEARVALDRLAWGPPVGRVDGARRPVTLAGASSPIERLLARGLLAATDDRTVTLPREVGLHLRGGRLFRDLRTAPPPLQGTARGARLADVTAGGQAFTFVRTLEDLLERWGVDPPGVLRGGGLGVRDLRATAAGLDVPQWTAALLVEVAYAAGLLARGGDADGPAGAAWLPTPAYDLWRLHDVERRWEELATAWLCSDRVPGLAEERDEHDRLINALSDGAARGSAPRVRRSVLAALADAPAGTAPSADSVYAYLTWRRPRRGGTLRERLVTWTLREAEALGLAGLGALAGHGRALLTKDGAATALAAVLPEPVDHVLIQADLTAVAPGPLVSDLARELSLAADVESTGGATVYRFTPESVRRALDAGRTASELIDLLRRRSSTGLPQPLTYLIEDVARRHGRLRVGVASAYVRSDDPAVLQEILADRRAQPLRLYRLAPTVLAARSSRAELLDGLRALGYAPVAESPEGSVVITRLDARRAESAQGAYERAHRALAGATGDPDTAVVDAAVRALRAGEEAARVAAPNGTPPRSPAMAMVKRLRQAADAGSRVWIGYLDQQGRASSRIIEPARVEGGFLTAYDATRASVQRFVLHRITGVADIDGSA